MRPQSIPPQYDSFPVELRAMPVWLLWDYQLVKDRWTKVPRIAERGAGLAKSNDPATWRSFDQARTLAGTASGIGLRLTAGYCGIDLDCCRDKQTGAVAPWAQRIVELIDSYTEVSPSGEGLHIIVRLNRDLPEGRRKWGGKDQGWEIAVYDKTSPRYFCATGVVVNGLTELRTCDPSEFYPQFQAGELDPPQAKAMNNPNGKAAVFIYDKQAHLMRGEWEGRYPSQSEADSALVWFLADEHGDDPVAIDREFRKSGLMRSKWDKQDGTGTYGSRTIANCLRKKREEENKGTGTPVWAEADLAFEFTGNSPDMRYVDDWKWWLHYLGGVWGKDRIRLIYDRALAVCLDACAAVDPKETATIKRLKSAQTRAAIENLARSDPRHAATSDQWDQDLFLLNTTGGTSELHTGELREHRAEDYLTKSTKTVPKSGDCTLWRQFLDKVTGGDLELQRYLQRVAGYCLTGVTSEHVLFFLYGTGANGKTTFTNILLGIWGDYAQVAQMETFTENKNDRHPTELAALRGARLVVASETEVGKRWAESRIKALTGGEPVRAHFMRCDDFEFIPQFKLMIQGNHKPGLRSVDVAIRRRVQLIPFTVTIPPEERDLKLGEKLREEWPQILQWAIDGCLAWQRQGLNPPAVVRDATEEYFRSEDAMLAWLDERVILSPQAGTTRTSVLYQDYKEWAERTGEHCGSQKRFSQELVDRGFKIRQSHGMVIDGLSLRPKDEA